MRGQVKCWFPDKGFGFIRAEDDSDVFVHFRDLRGTLEGLTKGWWVTFEVQPGKEKGKLRATNVYLDNPANEGSGPDVLAEDALRNELSDVAKISRRSPVMDAIVGVAAGHGWVSP